jgi:site-specific DNA-methyltransferase (adenine-specific)
MLEENKIYLGDCLNLMPSIPSKSIDMILCDLPYGTTACEWDSIIDMTRLWQEYERVIKDNGAIVLTACNEFTFLLYNSNPKLFRYRWIWEKSLATGFLLAKKQPMRNFEDVLVFYKKQPTYNPISFRKGTASKEKANVKNARCSVYEQNRLNLRTIYEDRLPTTILKFDSANNGSTTGGSSIHPTQKPVALFEYLIKTYTNEGELILDNCSGSGTTAVACMNTNRRFICIEKDETYHRKSLERLANHEPLLHMGDKC